MYTKFSSLHCSNLIAYLDSLFQQCIIKYDSLKISDYKTGFGGKFGLQKDRVDKSAVKSYDEESEKIGTNYEKTRPDGTDIL